ncbi:MAG: hypothetical protein IJY12_00330, partial [Clostridia bacterium]|nr:hypothetical protein [Clostridia bacterium]
PHSILRHRLSGSCIKRRARRNTTVGGDRMKQKSKTHTAKGMRFYYVFVALFSLLLGLYAVSVVNDVYAFVKSDVTATVTVTEEMTSFEVGKELSTMGLLRHKTVFGLYAKEAAFAPGEYVISAQLDYEDIVEALAAPTTP